MDAEELAARLGVTVEAIDGYVRQGMPEVKAGEFEPHQVENWLLDTGIGQYDEEQIATTSTAAARILGVSTRTIYTWLQSDDFPGAKGYFPVDAIRQWRGNLQEDRAQQRAGSRADGEPSAQDQLRFFKLAQLRRELIDVTEVRRLVLHCHEAAANVVRQIPERLEPALSGVTDLVRARARRLIADAVNDALFEIARSVREYESEMSDQ